MFVNDEFLDFVGSSKCLLILDGDADVVVIIVVGIGLCSCDDFQVVQRVHHAVVVPAIIIIAALISTTTLSGSIIAATSFCKLAFIAAFQVTSSGRVVFGQHKPAGLKYMRPLMWTHRRETFLIT